MANNIDKGELGVLLAPQPHPAVSVMIPTSPLGQERLTAPIRLKNLAESAERTLIDNGTRPSDARAFLQPIRELASSRDWSHQEEGLALFLSANGMWTVSTPYPIQERVLIDTRFFVRPLLPLLENEDFYLLQLDLHHIRLLKGDARRIDEIHVPGLPKTREEVVRPGHPQKQSRGHSAGSPGRAGSRITHGSTAVQDEEKEQILQVCHAVDRAIGPVCLSHHAPLVLAGVDHILDIYRRASHLDISANQIEGSTKTLSDEALRAKAYSCVRDRFSASKAEEIEKYRATAGTGLTSSDLSEIVLAALGGRVRSLFVRSDAIAWGSYDPQTGLVHHSAEPGPGDEELLNLAVVNTLADGGTAYELSQAEMPSTTAIAAVFRY